MRETCRACAASAGGHARFLRRFLEQRLHRREPRRDAARYQVVELARGHALVLGAPAHPEVQAVRTPHAAVHVDAVRDDAERRERAAVEAGQHLRIGFGADIEGLTTELHDAGRRQVRRDPRQRVRARFDAGTGHQLQPVIDRAEGIAERPESLRDLGRQPSDPRGTDVPRNELRRRSGVVAGFDVAVQGTHRVSSRTLRAPGLPNAAPRPSLRRLRRFPLTDPKAAERGHLQTLLTLAPWLWPAGEPALRARVVVALLLMVAAKGANVLVPLAYARAVDALTPKEGAAAIAAVPIALVLGYGLLRDQFELVLGAARRGVREGAGAGRAAHRAPRVPAPARAVAPLPPGPADGRAVAGAGAGHARHHLRARLHAVHHLPHASSRSCWWRRSSGGCSTCPSPRSRSPPSASTSPSPCSSPTGACASGGR